MKNPAKKPANPKTGIERFHWAVLLPDGYLMSCPYSQPAIFQHRDLARGYAKGIDAKIVRVRLTMEVIE